MHSTAQAIPYSQTAKFSKIVLDYIDEAPELFPFYAQPPTVQGIEAALQNKALHPVDRHLLVSVLQQQYGNLTKTNVVDQNIASLLAPTTFTICTAHQPNLFTGPLYFIYKILHAVKLADYLNLQFPDKHFIPVYYMGSEDADLAELNHISVKGKKYEWKTEQTGAVGRMLVDKNLIELIDELQGQIGIEKWGPEFSLLLKQFYVPGVNIQTATFHLVNALFASYGLLVFIPDHPDVKRSMQAVFKQELLYQSSAAIVNQTSEKLNQHYKVQAHARAINLFYLKDNIRERIIKDGNNYIINNTTLQFSEEELVTELADYPEHFSPNVILRGLMQETLLPNVAFIGGGGEVAYWLQLKDLFNTHKIPFPVLVLRNSFLFVEKRWKKLQEHLALSDNLLFESDLHILDAIIEKEGKTPSLNGETDKLIMVYEELKKLVSPTDNTLSRHIEALKVKAATGLHHLEKKLLRAERKKRAAAERQIQKLKQELFPQNNLQERVENLSFFYAKWGPKFIQLLYQASLPLEQQFQIIEIE